MKKLFAILITAALMFSLASCSAPEDNNGESGGTAGEPLSRLQFSE